MKPAQEHPGVHLKLTYPIALAIVAGLAAAQTRTAEIDGARDQKEAALHPHEPSATERFLRQFKDHHWPQRVSTSFNGMRIKLGNMPSGSGFALGPEYLREDFFDGNLMLRASAQASTRHYLKFEAESALRNLLGGRFELDAAAAHRDYRSLNYFGPGPHSRRDSRTVYRLEDTSVDATGIMHPARFINVGAAIGGLWLNVGPGIDDRYMSADKVFTPAVAPGIDRQTNFRRQSVFGQIDYRDNPLSPKAGGSYVFEYAWYTDRELDAYCFRRMDVYLQQYVPFLNKTHRLALRALGTFTESDPGRQVPFYLQPALGGSDDLRGFNSFRFSDRNKVLYNAEYRWEIFAGLDGSLFFDAGKVMPKRSQLAFSQLETSAGFGLRFHFRNATLFRFDVGFSHEGAAVWLKFNDAFNSRRVGASTGQPAY